MLARISEKGKSLLGWKLATLMLGAALVVAGGYIAWTTGNAPQHNDRLVDLAPAFCRANPTSAPALFLAENDAAMEKMMADMTIQPSGDVDRDFAAMMIAHHQGAIDMAKAVLRFGSNEQIRRLAQEIIITQQQEIVVMRQAVGEPLPPPAGVSQPRSTMKH